MAGPSSGFFQGASGTDAKYGTFTDASGNATVVNYITNNVQAEESLFKTLVARVVPGAAYDSSQHEYAPCCLPETRTGVLAKMREWIDSNDARRPIFWLSGPGGSGKSAIAHTFAEECKAKKILAGTFFFLRGDKFRSSHHNFFLTLAYQLAISMPSMRTSMQKALADDPSIPSKTLGNQFKMLICDPLLEQSIATPKIIVIDALDECEDKDGILKVISIIISAYRNPSFPLRFLFTSRAYDYICGKFRDRATRPLTTHANLQDWKANDDIRRFLRDGFDEIRTRKERIMRHLPELWPSDRDLDLAVEKSEGLFIWAATVVKFVGSERGFPDEKLKSTLKLHPGLDSLYRQVIEDAPRDHPYETVIGAIPLLRIRFPTPELGLFLHLQVHQILYAVQGLEPILDIPEGNDKPLQPYHASLHDFLTDHGRSNDLCINPAKQHGSIMLQCLKIVTEDNVTVKQVTDYACRNLFHHFRCTLMQGMDDLLPPQFNDFEENWRRLCDHSFQGWFDVLFQGDELLDGRRDLGAIILKLESLPARQRPSILIETLRRMTERMLREVKAREQRFYEQEVQLYQQQQQRRRQIQRQEQLFQQLQHFCQRFIHEFDEPEIQIQTIIQAQPQAETKTQKRSRNRNRKNEQK